MGKAHGFPILSHQVQAFITLFRASTGEADLGWVSHGFIIYEWSIFPSYVELPEGTVHIRICIITIDHCIPS